MNNKKSIWFWQKMVTPHMVALASALAELGHDVNYVANEILSEKRIKQGWVKPNLGKLKLLLAPDKEKVIQYALSASNDSIHFCQGLRGNGLVKYAQIIIRNRRLQHWVMMENIDDEGLIGFVKKIIYRIIILKWRSHLAGILAIGNSASSWFAKRGMYKSRILPFAYFLKEPDTKYLLEQNPRNNKNRPFRFIFVGQLIKLKRVDHLLKGLKDLKNKNIELWIVGDGPEKKRLEALANFLLPKKVRWLGVLSINKIPDVLSQVDCLVLPSRYDGWGAVVTESLMVGTPVICSNKCGSSIIVQASKVGYVFPANNIAALSSHLNNQYIEGPVSIKERQKIISWGKNLGANSGAKYLETIINTKQDKLLTIKLPWN